MAPVPQIKCGSRHSKLTNVTMTTASAPLCVPSASAPQPLASVIPCSNCKLYPMMTPIYQCYEGHVICRRCDWLEKCPTCKEPLPNSPKIRCLSLELLQPKLLKCNIRGCLRQFLHMEELQTHKLLQCKYLEMPVCRLLGFDSRCRTTFAPVDRVSAMRHLTTDHDSDTIKSYKLKSLSTNLNIGICFPDDQTQEILTSAEGHIHFALTYTDGFLFILKIECKSHRRLLTPFILSPSQTAKDYVLNIRFLFYAAKISDLPISLNGQQDKLGAKPDASSTQTGIIAAISDISMINLNCFTIDGGSSDFQVRVAYCSIDKAADNQGEPSEYQNKL